MAFVLTRDELVPEPQTRIIKADDYAALVRANEILGEAEASAQARIREALQEAEEKKLQGYQDGVMEGKAEVAEQMFATMTASVEHLSGMEATLVDLVIRSLRTILGTFENDELAARIVQHALRLVRDEKRVVLRVSANEAESIGARLEDIAKRYPGMGRIDLVPDVSLAPGGCVMETEVGVIDASLERQLAMIEESFRKQLGEQRD